MVWRTVAAVTQTAHAFAQGVVNHGERFVVGHVDQSIVNFLIQFKILRALAFGVQDLHFFVHGQYVIDAFLLCLTCFLSGKTFEHAHHFKHVSRIFGAERFDHGAS